MRRKKYFKTIKGQKIPLPAFFPDATKAVVRTLDSLDLVNTKTLGILVNTYHLYKNINTKTLEKFAGIGGFMSWKGAIISDSGGFQVMTLAKRPGRKGKIFDEGVFFVDKNNQKTLFTPKDSIEYQMKLATDMVVVLDDFTPPNAGRKAAQETVDRTVLWAKKSKEVFESYCQRFNIVKRPYLLGVVQGGDFKDLRKQCIERLCEIGFDGLGFGGWAINAKGVLDLELSQFIADNTPKDYLLYGLGIGKPEDIVKLTKMGYQIFDCVLPTRDARHGRLYIYNSTSIDKISLSGNFYSYYKPDRIKYFQDKKPVSEACDCLLCKNYSRGYLAHLFRIKETTALRLATIHNLRFYSLLIEKIRSKTDVKVQNRHRKP